MCLEDRKRKGLYRVILCVRRIERESLLCWYECDVSDVSNRERICGRNLENECTEKK